MEGLFQPTHLIFIFVALVASVALSIIPIVLVYLDYDRIPPNFRKMEPGLVWLLLIPCFGIVWNFFVYPRLADSFKAYFDSIGDTSVDDCGRDLAMGYAVCCAVSIIPFLGCLTSLAALVLIVLFLVKANEFKNRIPVGIRQG
jgi:hypothetical protein